MKSAKLLSVFLALILACNNLLAVSQFELSTLKARAALGDNSARYKLGIIIMYSEKPEDVEKMIDYFRAGAEAGHAGCMGKFALYQLHGIGSLAKDQVSGSKMLQEAAVLKDPETLAMLSEIHFNGYYGFAKDIKLATKYLEESCELKSPTGFSFRAGCYEHGIQGYPKDSQAAKRDYLSCAKLTEESALDFDSPSVQMSLYHTYVRAEHYDAAREWLDKAVLRGSYAAITEKAFCWSFGAKGHTKDLVQAYACYNLAASLRPERFPKDALHAEEARDNLAKDMTGSQVAEAQRLSTEMNAKIRKY
jgi:TPR repeat protein